MPPTDLARTQRLFEMARLLRCKPLTVRDLAVQLFPAEALRGTPQAEVERTVVQDLADLERLEPDHFRRVPGRPPRYLLRTQRTALSPTTLLTLHATARLAAQMAPGRRRPFLAALDSLTEWLPEPLQPVLRRSLEDPGEQRSLECLHLERACAAWTKGHPLRFEYLRPGGTAGRRTGVLEIYLIEADPITAELWLIGRETTYHQAVRCYKLSHLRAVHVLEGEQYRIPDSFNPREYLSGAWGRAGRPGVPALAVQLRFRHDAAYRILEGGYAHLSEPFLNPDGTIDTSFEVRSGELPREAFAWILGWGSAVQVLGPPDVRARWQQELRSADQQAGFTPQRFAAPDVASMLAPPEGWP